MTRSLVSGRHVLFSALGVSLMACSFDSELPMRSGSAAPASSGVMLSGAGADNDADAVGYGQGSRISDIDGSVASHSPAADDPNFDLDSGGARQSAVELRGAASSGGSTAIGDAGAAGSTTNDGTEASSKVRPVLWFSEYIEGSSSNKALEIAARDRSVLDGCKVGTYFNGKTEATVVAVLSGVLEAGQVLTLCTSALKEKLGASCNQIGNLTFNGDDVVTLSCDGEVLDVIGQIGVDPGDAWGSDPDRTADHTLRRKCSVSSGDPIGTDSFDPSAEWLSLPIDTFDGLGTLGC